MLFVPTQGGNGLSAVLLFVVGCWAHLTGSPRNEAEVSHRVIMPSRRRDQWNLIGLNLVQPAFWVEHLAFLDGLAFYVSIAASPTIISVPKKHPTHI